MIDMNIHSFERDIFSDEDNQKLFDMINPLYKTIKQTCDNDSGLKEDPDWESRISESALKKYIELDIIPDTPENGNRHNFSSNVLHMERQDATMRKMIKKYAPHSQIVHSNHLLYPKTGWMGWHTNFDASCERIYITYASEDKKSFFRYYDYEKDKIITDYDNKGITVRRFNITSSEPYFWHCVGSECDRFSYGFRLKTNIVLPPLEYKMLTEQAKKNNQQPLDRICTLIRENNEY